MKQEITLDGLDGGNPLAFLAALGTFRVLSSTFSPCDLRLGWRASGTWHPVLSSTEPFDVSAIVRRLHEHLTGSDALAVFDALDPNLKMRPGDFRAASARESERTQPRDRRRIDLISAIACDAVGDDLVDVTAFKLAGGGQQRFLTLVRDIYATCTPGQVRRALFQPWDYADPGPTLRWDPVDDRRWALRWDDPSGAPIKTMRAANALAVEGLAMLPAVPGARSLNTTGFRRVGRRQQWWTWPIWTGQLTLDTVYSLLAHGELQLDHPDRDALAAMGMGEVYRAQRIAVGKYKNFTPAQPA